MIRGIAGPIRRVLAHVLVAGIIVTGLPARAAAQYVTKDGKLTRTDPESRQARHLPTPTEIQKIASDLEKTGVLQPERLKLVRVFASIASADSRQRRSELIRQLPVTIVSSQDAAGNTVKNFIVRGQVRLSVTERSRGAALLEDQDFRAPVSGPAVAEDRDPCFEDEPEPCMTEGEMDELGMLAAYTQAEMEALASDIDAEIAEYEQWCSSNPGMCLTGAIEASRSGPSADCEFNCLSSAYIAAGATLTGVGASVQAGTAHAAARAAGRALSVAVGTGWGIVILGSAIVAVGSYNAWKECRGAPRLHGALHAHLLEPTY